jgi:hypothetical protein
MPSSTCQAAERRWLDCSEIVATANDLLDIWSQKNRLGNVSILTMPTGKSVLTCSYCAVYDPLTSTSGGYASTMPLETRLLSCNVLAKIDLGRSIDHIHRGDTCLDPIYPDISYRMAKSQSSY